MLQQLVDFQFLVVVIHGNQVVAMVQVFVEMIIGYEGEIETVVVAVDIVRGAIVEVVVADDVVVVEVSM